MKRDKLILNSLVILIVSISLVILISNISVANTVRNKDEIEDINIYLLKKEEQVELEELVEYVIHENIKFYDEIVLEDLEILNRTYNKKNGIKLGIKFNIDGGSNDRYDLFDRVSRNIKKDMEKRDSLIKHIDFALLSNYEDDKIIKSETYTLKEGR